MAIQIPQDPWAELLSSLPELFMRQKQAQDEMAFRREGLKFQKKQELNAQAFRQKQLDFREFQEMLGIVEGLDSADQKYATLQHIAARYPQYADKLSPVMGAFDEEADKVAFDRERFSSAMSEVSMGNFEIASKLMEDITNPDLVASITNSINMSRRTEVAETQAEKDVDVFTPKAQRLQLAIEKLQSRYDSMANLNEQAKKTTGRSTGPYDNQLTALGSRINSFTTQLTEELGIESKSPAQGDVGAKQYTYQLITGSGFLTPNRVIVSGPGGASVNMLVRDVEKAFGRPGKRSKEEKDTLLNRIMRVFGVDSTKAEQILSQIYESRTGVEGETTVMDISIEEQDIIDQVSQEYAE